MPEERTLGPINWRGQQRTPRRCRLRSVADYTCYTISFPEQRRPDAELITVNKFRSHNGCEVSLERNVCFQMHYMDHTGLRSTVTWKTRSRSTSCGPKNLRTSFLGSPRRRRSHRIGITRDLWERPWLYSGRRQADGDGDNGDPHVFFLSETCLHEEFQDGEIVSTNYQLFRRGRRTRIESIQLLQKIALMQRNQISFMAMKVCF